jgi:hypothetical protein
MPLVVILVHVLLHLIVLTQLLLPWVPLLLKIAPVFLANLPDRGRRPPGTLPILSIQRFIILAIHNYPGLPILRGVLLLQPCLGYLHCLLLLVMVGPEGGRGFLILILLLLLLKLILVGVGT